MESEVTKDVAAFYAVVDKTKSKESNPLSKVESSKGVVHSLADGVGESGSVQLLSSPVAPCKSVAKGDKRAAAFFKYYKVLIILLFSASLAVMTFACFVVSVYAGKKIASLNVQLENANTSLENELRHFNNFAQEKNVSCDTNIFISCSSLPPYFPSGYYWVNASNGSAVRVYCDMTRSCGNVTGRRLLGHDRQHPAVSKWIETA